MGLSDSWIKLLKGASDNSEILILMHRVLNMTDVESLWIDNENKNLSFAKGDLIYIFNFSPSCSPADFFVHAHITGEGQYRAIFSTNNVNFGGLDRVGKRYIYYAKSVEEKGLGIEAYVPCRTAMIFQRIFK